MSKRRQAWEPINDPEKHNGEGMRGMMLAGMIFLGAVCADAQSITVKSDKKLNTDFSRYKTFYWSSQVDRELDEGLYFLNDLVLKADIRDAVKSELQGLGYKLKTNSPDLIVNFRVFDKPVTLKGHEGYGITYWGQDEYREASDTASYRVDAGTLLISLADRKNGHLVWQGFASGLIDNNAFIKDEGKIREAVNLIFDEYGYRANQYDTTNK